MHSTGIQNSEDQSSLYLCGFNGFGQINQLCKDCQNSQNDISYPMFYASPQKSVVSNAVRVVSTWSKICVITDTGQLYVTGLKHKDNNFIHSHSDQVYPNIAATCDNINVFKRTPEKLCFVAEGEITLKDLDITEEIQVKEVAGRDKELAVVSEDQHIYSGLLQQLEGGPVQMTLTLISPSLKIQSVSCGMEHTLLLSYTGEVYSYGMGSRGQLGYGDLHVDRQTTPLPIETLSGLVVTGIAAAGWHSTAVTAEGDIYVWGWNESGQLGLPNGKQEVKEFYSSLVQSKTTVTSVLEKKTTSEELQPENIEDLRTSDTSFLKAWDVSRSGQSDDPTFLQSDRPGFTSSWNTRHSCDRDEDVSTRIPHDKQNFLKTWNAGQSRSADKSQSEDKSCSIDSDQHYSNVSVKTDFVTALTNNNLEKPDTHLTDKPSISKAWKSSCSRDSRYQDSYDVKSRSFVHDWNASRSQCSGEHEKLHQNATSFKEAWKNNRSMNTAHDYSEAKRQKFSNSWNTCCSVGAEDTDLDLNQRPSFARTWNASRADRTDEKLSNNAKLSMLKAWNASCCNKTGDWSSQINRTSITRAWNSSRSRNIEGQISAVHGEQRSDIKLHHQRMPMAFYQDTEPVQIQGVPKVLDLPEIVKVTKVSCGSRHTAVLLDNGCLMTTGWNGYGQMCHGDVTSRDFFQIVAFFTDQQLVVTNVFCDNWTTAIIAKAITWH